MLEQSDGSAWMAKYCLDLLEMSLVLAGHDRGLRGRGHQVLRALHADRHGHERPRPVGRRVRLLPRPAASARTGATYALRAFSMVGLIPLTAATIVEPELRVHAGRLQPARMEWFLANRPAEAAVVAHSFLPGRHQRSLLSIVGPERLAAHRRRHARRGPLPVAARPALAVARARRCAASCCRLDGTDVRAALRAGREPHGHLRRQLELARPGVVPRQLPA